MNSTMIYFDNAATSWPKPETVYEKTDAVMRTVSGNPGRGNHSASLRGGRIVQESREEIAVFFNASSSNRVIFTSNGTDSLNIAIKGLLKPGDRVLISPYEHNSVTRPLNSLKNSGVIVEQAKINKDLTIDMDSVEEICNKGVDYAVISHCSNVTGIVSDMEQISRLVHNAGGILISDAAQSAGTIEINMQKLGIDILAAPGHKGLMGPMGIGILLMSDEFPIKPFREGGTGILSEEDFQPQRLPFRLEAGTANLPGIAGLAEGIRFIKNTGIQKIRTHETELAKYLMEELAKIDGIHFYSNTKNPQTGTVSFTADFAEPSLIETILDQAYQIQIRSGLHCSPLTHKNIGTFPQGTVRVSFGYYNTASEVENFVGAMKALRGV